MASPMARSVKAALLLLCSQWWSARGGTPAARQCEFDVDALRNCSATGEDGACARLTLSLPPPPSEHGRDPSVVRRIFHLHFRKAGGTSVRSTVALFAARATTVWPRTGLISALATVLTLPRVARIVVAYIVSKNALGRFALAPSSRARVHV